LNIRIPGRAPARATGTTLGGELLGLPRTVAGCDSLAAAALASDSSVHPVRREIVLVSNPRLGVSGIDEDPHLRHPAH
jgi:hypothetical protein